MKPEDLHWLAGLLEGKGCFQLKIQDANVNQQLALHMADEQIIRRAAALLDTPVFKVKNGEKIAFRFNVTGAKARAAMDMLYPLMGDRQKARIDLTRKA